MLSSTKRTILIFIAIIMLAMYASASAEEQQVNLEIANEYIRIIINTLEENMGRFSVGTTGGDPDRAGDENQHLIYGGEEPWTSYTTVRIGNQNWVYGNSTNRRAGRSGSYGTVVQPPAVVDNSLVSSWQLGPILVTQTLSFARSITTGLMDTAKIEYELLNTDSVSHLVGLRLVIDTMLGQNDGAPFRLQDRAILTDTVFYRDQMPAFWQAFDSLSNPRVMSQGTLVGGEVTTPDRVYFSNWGSIVDGLWNFEFQPGRDFTRSGEFELDSAIAMYWDQKPLAPNESRTYVSYYGLGGVTISPGELSVGLTSPWQVRGDRRHRESFTIVAYIQNTGKGEARNVTATLSLPPELELVSASSTPMRRNFGTLDVNETIQTSWQVIPTGDFSGNVTYQVKVDAENSESSTARRSIEIVRPDYLDIKLEGPLALGIENERLSPLPMQVTAEITNTGGAAAHNVTAVLSHPMFRLPQGEHAVKQLGTIEPNQSATAVWHLDPSGVSGQLVYSLTVSSDTDTYIKDNFVLVPYIEPKVFVGEPQTTKAKITAGEYFSIPILAANLPDFRRAELEIGFDPDMLEIVGRSLDITRGTLFVDTSGETAKLLDWQTPRVDNIKGVVSGISGDRGTGNSLPSAFGTLITIHFRAKQSGTAEININNVSLYDSQLYSITAAVENREIVIE